jgi:hypothetical protein
MLHAKNLGLAAGILWGACLFLCTLISMQSGYAMDYLMSLKGLYPGYSISGAGAFVGLIYGFIDGFVFLWLFGTLYNRLMKGR